MQPRGSKLCDGGCGRLVSAHKRKCLRCIEKEIDFHLKVAAFKGEAIGLEDNPHPGDA
jgi:hypothetical protein